MKELHASAFPELRQVFTGYLHEDYIAEYGSAANALAAFHDDASDAERRRFRKEARRLLTATESLEFWTVVRLLESLGSRWVPPSRDALVRLLEPATSGNA